MFNNKDKPPPDNQNDLGVFRPAKGSAKVIIGNGVKFKGEITIADEVQVDGNADIIPAILFSLFCGRTSFSVNI